MADVNSEDAEKDTVSQMARDAEEYGVQVTKAILQCMPNPDGENCVTEEISICLLYTSPSPRDLSTSRMPSSA